MAYTKAYYRAHWQEIQEKNKAYRTAHADENRERVRLYNKAYEESHKEERLLYHKNYKAEHKEHIRLREEKKHAANPNFYKERYKRYASKRRQYSAQWVLENPEKSKAATRRWKKQNPEKCRAYNSRRRALKLRAKINDFTAEQWASMQIIYGHRCVYCGVYAQGQLAQDHLHPLSRGGNHTFLNILPSCKSCNSRKSNGPKLPFYSLHVLSIQMDLYNRLRAVRLKFREGTGEWIGH